MTASTERVIVAMRHGLRVDRSIDSMDIRLWDIHDRRRRPYDCPIVADTSLPTTNAQHLKAFNISMVVSSPFRRCIQTAGIVCRELGIREIHIDFGLSENMTYIRDNFGCTGELEFLSIEQMHRAAGEGISIVSMSGGYSLLEDDRQTATRFQLTFGRLLNDHASHSILCVTHWDGVMRLATEVMNYTSAAKYAHVEECGFLALRTADRHPIAAHGVKLDYWE